MSLCILLTIVMVQSFHSAVFFAKVDDLRFKLLLSWFSSRILAYYSKMNMMRYLKSEPFGMSRNAI